VRLIGRIGISDNGGDFGDATAGRLVRYIHARVSVKDQGNGTEGNALLQCCDECFSRRQKYAPGDRRQSLSPTTITYVGNDLSAKSCTSTTT
jgi:hypothetical protein